MQNQQPRLSESDIKNSKDVACESCGNKFFVNVFVIKQISALVSPSGKEINAPIPTFACNKCNNINKQFLPTQDE